MYNICRNQNLLLFWKTWPEAGFHCVQRCINSKNFCKICTIFPKWRLKNGPKNGARIWPPKWSPKMASKGRLNILFLVDLFQVKICGILLDATFGCHFWTPFWRSNSGTIFGSIFEPPFSSPKMVQILQKFLLSKLHNKLFSSKQTCTSKCICGDFLASCISEHTAILSLVKPSKITTSFDSHKCCT